MGDTLAVDCSSHFLDVQQNAAQALVAVLLFAVAEQWRQIPAISQQFTRFSNHFTAFSSEYDSIVMWENIFFSYIETKRRECNL